MEEERSLLDRELLQEVDAYLCEHGRIFDQDWPMIATCLFGRPTRFEEVRSRFYHLKTFLQIETTEDYNSYQGSLNKGAWVACRRSAKLTKAMEHYVQMQSLKNSIYEAATTLKEDLDTIEQDLTMETLFSRDLWQFLGGRKRLTFMLYIELVGVMYESIEHWSVAYDGLVETTTVEEDMRTLFERFGNEYNRPEPEDVPSGIYPSEEGLDPKEQQRYLEENEEYEYRNREEPYARPCKVNAEQLTTIMADRVNGFLSLDDWKLVLGAGWFKPTPPENLPPKGVYDINLGYLGIQPTRTSREITMDYYSHVLPNYWLFQDLVAADGNLKTIYSFNWGGQYGGWLVAMTIYHSLTLVSLHHVKKTVVYLISVGILKCDHMTPKDWIDGFVKLLIRLPCGEIWNADPEEFESARTRLAREMNVPDVQRGATNRAQFCIKGANCYWKDREG